MKAQLWQLYDQEGRPITSHGARKTEVAVQGMLHASAHVWLWRHNEGALEILIQKRAALKINWPGMLDKSAGGHVMFGEEPMVAAIRKTKEELGIMLDRGATELVGVKHWRALVGDTDLIDNEFQWIYQAEYVGRDIELDDDEVESVGWKKFEDFQAELADRRIRQYVPYGKTYYDLVVDALQQHLPEPTARGSLHLAKH